MFNIYLLHGQMGLIILQEMNITQITILQLWLNKSNL